LTYLTRHYDPEHKFSFTEPLDVSRAEQWMAWQHGGLGPMQGQANHFNRFAKERIAYGMQRYTGETERLVGILDTQLKDNDYLVGNKYSIADIASFGWIHIHARPAVQKGLAVPSKPGIGNDVYLQKLKDDQDFAQKEKDLAEQIQKAKDQYGYKYSSP
jgi:glutathione S-transferase